jgi:nicotinate dehydrogenase large molybdopterin subunit
MEKKEEAPLKIVGKDLPRVNAPGLVLGETRFADDFVPEGLVHLKILRSPKPHALIKSIRTEGAIRMPGVVRVFTAKDIPGTNRIGPLIKDQHVLADGKVRFVGDAIALVAAETGEQAEAALERIDVEYEELEPVLSREMGLRPEAPKIHEKGNVLIRRLVTKGDVEKGFREADLVVERTYTTSWIEHAYLEPDAGFAYTDERSRVVLHVSTQNIFYHQEEIAAVLGLGTDRVRVIQSATGGGFGSKNEVTVHCCLGLAAFHLKRPVKLVYTHEEVFATTPKRHSMTIHYRTGVTRQGRLTAVELRILADTGPYASAGETVATRAAIHGTGPYEVPNYNAESVMVYTNNCISGSMRGFGNPQTAFAYESQMDIIAGMLGMDPIELRLKNALKVGSRTGTGQVLQESVGMTRTLERINEWREENRKAEGRTPPMDQDRIARGTGVASIFYAMGLTGRPSLSRVRIEIETEGRIVLYVGTAEIGQGSDTVFTQIAAETLGVEPSEIHLVRADTDVTPFTGASSASRQTYVTGNAVQIACMNIKEILFREAREIYGLGERELYLETGRIVSRDIFRASIPLSEIAERVYREGRQLKGDGFYDTKTTWIDPETGQGSPYATYSYASQLAEVEVDRETGEVTVNRIVVAQDVGKAINPASVIGQINGGVVMGLGMALTEEFIPGETNSFFNYFVPTIKDIPEIVTMLVEEEEPTGPFGAKGVGEPCMIPTAAAILNAIANALGTRIYDLPATLERVRIAAGCKLAGRANGHG